MLKFQYVNNQCPLCSAQIIETYLTKKYIQGDVSWVFCHEDKIAFQSPRLDDTSIMNLFSSSEYTEGKGNRSAVGYFNYLDGEKARMQMYKKKIKAVEKLYPEGRKLRVFEIGCASGTFLQACKENGHEVEGIDASDIFAGYARDLYGLDVRVGLVEHEKYEENSFDVIAIYGSLSSFSDPVRIFKKIIRLLREGGLLVFNTPIVDGFLARLLGKRLWMYKPSSQVIYTKDAVKRLLQKTGFEAISIERDKQAVSIEKLAYVSNLPIIGKILAPFRSWYLYLPVPSVIMVYARAIK